MFYKHRLVSGDTFGWGVIYSEYLQIEQGKEYPFIKIRNGISESEAISLAELLNNLSPVFMNQECSRFNA